jgi:hypothetical protein
MTRLRFAIGSSFLGSTAQEVYWPSLEPRKGATLRRQVSFAAMTSPTSLFEVRSLVDGAPLVFAAVLLLILIVSFRSRATVFCQYLHAMTGISLRPPDVRRVFREKGRDGVRELFLDLIIREDLKKGPLEIPCETSKGE